MIDKQKTEESSENRRILILYHSGSGSTRTIGEVLQEKLSRSHRVDMIRVSPDFDYQSLSHYDFILCGFPTYHCQPSTSMLEFVDGIPSIDTPRSCFVFTTCGLYAGNSLRVLIKELVAKNIITTGYTQIRGPASDGVLLYPSSLSLMFRYQKRARQKMEKAASAIGTLMSSHVSTLRIPAYKWYVPINNVLTNLGEKKYGKYRDNLHVLSDRCTNCNVCVKNCQRNCWTEGEESPSFTPANCEFCLGCVHGCPHKAIVFSDNMKDKPRLNRAFYGKLKQEMLAD